MAEKTLKTLVLRGVTVVTGGLTVDPRMGSGYTAVKQAPAPVSMRHPSPANPNEAEPPSRRLRVMDHHDAGDDERAGRPGGRAGFLAGRSRALTAGRVITAKWWPALQGGPSLTAARRPGFTTARATASVGQTAPANASTRGMRAWDC